MNNKGLERIWLSLARMGGTEQKYIQQAFDTNWVAPLGPNVDAFEEALSAYLGWNRSVVALASGTAAIHLGLIQLGVGPGDEVICQSFTFVASANPIRYLGASPVFIDSEKDNWNMDPALLEEAIRDRIRQTGKKPKAIIPVHLYGMPARMDRIMEIADCYNIQVLEDAAEALGSSYLGKKCGSFGHYACLSFNGNKIITTSGGGALVCSTPEEALRTKFYATQARDQAPHYEHTEIGYNYRLSNVCAGIGRGQLEVIGDFLERRRKIHAYYRDQLAGMNGITMLENPSAEFESNHWLTCLQVDPSLAGFSREQLQAAMEDDNIETRPLWKPMHLQPLYKDAPFYGNGISEGLFRKGLCLPSSPILSDNDLERIITTLLNFIRQR